MKEGFSIVEFSPIHIPGAAQVEKACFAQPWSESSLASQLERGDTVMLAALAGQATAGWAGLEHSFGEGSVLNIAVLPGYRRLGIGEALAKALIGRAAALGLDWLTLEVRPSNAAAVALYRKLGFAEIGRRPNFYSFPREDALLMRRHFSEK